MWQEIESAPKDGTCILIYSEKDERVIGYWDNGDEDEEDNEPCWTSYELRWLDSEPIKPIHYPTHWMPLPEPPTPAADTE